jgi:hypothetical protein
MIISLHSHLLLFVLPATFVLSKPMEAPDSTAGQSVKTTGGSGSQEHHAGMSLAAQEKDQIQELGEPGIKLSALTCPSSRWQHSRSFSRRYRSHG